jgi:hypothetical protein
LYSCTSSRRVCSPPVTAGNTTCRTASSGASSAASAMANKMFSLPVTFLKALTSSWVTRRSARALIRCTVEIRRSTRVSVISRSRQCNSAASSTNRSSVGCLRRCDGASTAARARQPASTFGATSANMPAGSPVARTARSLRISVSIDSRLTLPGVDFTNANSDSAVSSTPAASSYDVSASTSTTASNRRVVAVDNRAASR